MILQTAASTVQESDSIYGNTFFVILGAVASVVTIYAARIGIARFLTALDPRHKLVSPEESLESMPKSERDELMPKLWTTFKPRVDVAEFIRNLRRGDLEKAHAAIRARLLRNDPEDTVAREVVDSWGSQLHELVEWSEVVVSAARAGQIEPHAFAAVCRDLGLRWSELVSPQTYLEDAIGSDAASLCAQMVESYATGRPGHLPMRGDCRYHVRVAESPKDLVATVPSAFQKLGDTTLFVTCEHAFDRHYKEPPSNIRFDYVLGVPDENEQKVGPALALAFDDADVFYRETMPIDPDSAEAAAVKRGFSELQQALDSGATSEALASQCRASLGFELSVATGDAGGAVVPTLVAAVVTNRFVYSLVFSLPDTIDWSQPVRLKTRCATLLALDRCAQFPLVLAGPTRRLRMSFDYKHAPRLGRVRSEPFFFSSLESPKLPDGDRAEIVEYDDESRFLLPGLLLVHWNGAATTTT